MNINKYYQKGRYDKKYILLRNFLLQEKGDIFINLLKPETISLLDVGCGDGALAAYLREKTGVKAYGIDISKRGVEIALKKGIIARVGDAQKKIPFRTQFDAVVANEVIEHLYNPDFFLREIKKVLKDDGILILGTPNMSYWFNRVLFVLGVYPLYVEVSTEFRKIGVGFLKSYVDNQPVGHIRVFNVPALKDLLRIHGFAVVTVRGLSVPFSSTNKLFSFLYKMIDSFFSNFPTFASDIVIVAQKA